MKSLIKTSALAIGLAVALGATAAEAQFRVMLPINPGVALTAGAPETPVDPQEPEQESLNDWSLLASDLPEGTSRAEYSFDFSTLITTDPVDYALADLSWSVDSLPDWLEIDPATGALSGTPPTYGETSFTVSADHAEEGSRQQGYTVTINGVPLEATQVSVRNSVACAITTEGAAMCWGAGGNGMLGNGSTSNTTVPTLVSGLESGVTDIEVGNQHVCAVHNGAAKCWGRGTNGMLGNGGTTDSNVPVQVTGLTSGVTMIRSGSGNSCAIHNGAAKCWGKGTNGILGNGSTANSNIPVQVTGLTSQVTSIAAGSYIACAVHNGAAKCWGSNNNGMLGNGSTTNSTVPVQVTGLNSGVTMVSAGGSSGHSCAVHNGAAKCWGLNSSGNLGNGSTTGSNVPVQVTGLQSNITSISAGNSGACALVSNSRARCWGFGGSGQLGNGGTANSSTYVQVSGLTSGVTSISAGSNTACAVHNGTAKCWGSASNGVRGDGLTSGNIPTPVQVIH